MKLRRLFFTLLIPFAAAQTQGQSEEAKLLEEINQKLTVNATQPAEDPQNVIMDKSWGSANLMGDFDPFVGGSGSSDVLSSLLGSSGDLSSSTSEKIQIVLDSLTYDMRPDVNAVSSVNAYLSANPGNRATYGRFSNRLSSLSSAIDSYRAIASLSDRTKSCISYWNVHKESSTMPNPTSAKPPAIFFGEQSVLRDLPTSSSSQSPGGVEQPSYALVSCSASTTSNFNGYTTIKNKAKEVSDLTLSTTAGTRFAELYNSARQQIEADKSVLSSPPAQPSNDDPAHDQAALSWLEQVDAKLDTLQESFQSIIAAELNASLSPDEKLMSISSIYDANNYNIPPGTLPTECTANAPLSLISDNDTNIRATQRCPQSHSQRQKSIKAAVGVAGGSPFKRGLTNPGSDTSVLLLVAGEHLEFTKTRSTDQWAAQPPKGRSGSKRAAMNEETMSNIKSARQAMESDFKTSRTTFSTDMLKAFLNKTGALDILNEIAQLRSVTKTFTNGNSTFNGTQMDALYYNSNWRLRGTGVGATGENTWLNRIGTMDIANLLRELLIIQAQTLQMQYTIYADNQKNLILNALQAADTKSDAGVGASRIPGILQDYLAGVQGLSPHTPVSSSGSMGASMNPEDMQATPGLSVPSGGPGGASAAMAGAAR